MTKIVSISRNTLVANIRNRIFWVLALFGVILLAASALLGLLGQEQELRVLMDLGLASIETLAMVSAVFLTVGMILEEMESKTLYLVLTRAVGRSQYLFGRYLGTLVSTAVLVAGMTALHAGLLFSKGWNASTGMQYATAVIMSFEKILLITAIGLFFSLFSSSSVVALTFTFFFWILGHFALELRFLIDETRGAAPRLVLNAVYLLIPHFQYLNARDLWIAVPDQMPQFFLRGTLYALLYSGALLALSLHLFRRKEF